jgi:hypothetical protein
VGESIIVPICNKDDTTDCSNDWEDLFANYIQNFIQNPAVKLRPYAEDVIGDHQCGFRQTRSATDHIFCIHPILEKKWEYNEAVHQLFIDFKKAYDPVRTEVLYVILIEFGIPVKRVRLIKMSEKYCRVWVGKNLSDMFPISNGLKQGDAQSPLLFKLALEYAIRRVQVNQDGLKLNVTHQLLVNADDANILDGSVHTIKKHAETLVVEVRRMD